MEDYTDCPAYVQEFLFYMLTIKGRSKRTVDGYYIDLRTFLRYIHCVKIANSNPNDTEIFTHAPISQIPITVIGTLSLGDFYAFLNYTVQERKNNAKTRSRKVSSIRSFFHYLTVKSNHLKINPVENLDIPSVKKSVPRYLSLEESLELLADIERDSPFYERDFCILTLFLNCGMRLSELVGIDLPDIRDNTVRILGKGNKERIVYLNNACLKALEAHVAQRQHIKSIKDKTALFLGIRGTRITPRRVEQIVAQRLSDAGLGGRGYSPHKLRHTAATIMYQHGNVDIRVLKEILGHANLGTTEIYTHLSSAQMETAANQNPLASVSPKKRRAKAPDPSSEDE